MSQFASVSQWERDESKNIPSWELAEIGTFLI